MCFRVKEMFTRVLVVGVMAGSLAACGGGGSAVVPNDAVLPEGSGSVGVDAEVVAVPNSALLTWDAPSERVNKTSIKMGEIKGYLIRYGQNFDELDTKIDVPNSGFGQESYRVTGLNDGQWYFTVQVVDQDGLMSAPSTTVSKSI